MTNEGNRLIMLQRRVIRFIQISGCTDLSWFATSQKTTIFCVTERVSRQTDSKFLITYATFDHAYKAGKSDKNREKKRGAYNKYKTRK